MIAILLGYLAGSVPFAFLLARRRGVDVRVAGSGNVGAANVMRTTGTGRAVAVMALDVAQGATPGALAHMSRCVAPIATGVAAGLFVVTVWLTRYVSLGSIAATIALPPAAWLAGAPGAVVGAAGGTAALILFRHRTNLRRLRAGTERRM